MNRETVLVKRVEVSVKRLLYEHSKLPESEWTWDALEKKMMTLKSTALVSYIKMDIQEKGVGHEFVVFYKLTKKGDLKEYRV